MPKIKPASVTFACVENDRKLSSASGDSETENVPPVMIYFGSQSGMVCYVRFYTNSSGTAEAFSSIINKELSAAGIPSKVEDLDRFEPEVFRYVACFNPLIVF